MDMDMIELSNTVYFFVCMLIGTYFFPILYLHQTRHRYKIASFLYKIG